MMKILLCLLLLMLFAFNQGKPHAQTKLKGTIGVNYAMSLTDGYLWFDNFELAVGVKVFDHLYFSAILGNARNHWHYKTQMDRLQIWTNSYSIAYRPLKSKYVLSPLVDFEVGYSIHSNSKGEFIDERFIPQDSLKPEVIGAFNKIRYFGRLKIMLDTEVNQFNFRIGANYNLYSIELKDKYNLSSSFIRSHKGIGFEMAVLYTFKRRQKDE